MLKWILNYFRKDTVVAVLTPETDLELLNRGVCPDCSSTSGIHPKTPRIVECNTCGSGYIVAPCCTPPFITASHVGFNREKYAAQRKLSTRSGIEDTL